MTTSVRKGGFRDFINRPADMEVERDHILAVASLVIEQRRKLEAQGESCIAVLHTLIEMAVDAGFDVLPEPDKEPAHGTN